MTLSIGHVLRGSRDFRGRALSSRQLPDLGHCTRSSSLSLPRQNAWGCMSPRSQVLPRKGQRSLPTQENRAHPRPTFLLADCPGWAEGRARDLKAGSSTCPRPRGLCIRVAETRRSCLRGGGRVAGAGNFVERFPERKAQLRALCWMLPPVSRLRFNYYFNFVLAERQCQIVPFKGKASFLQGAVAASALLAQGSLRTRGTCWFPKLYPVQHSPGCVRAPRRASRRGCALAALSPHSGAGCRAPPLSSGCSASADPWLSDCHISSATQSRRMTDTDHTGTCHQNKHLV